MNNGNAAQQENYTYDPLNNRKTKTIGTTTTAYVYDAANQLQDIHAGTATGTLLADLNYDANGNLINRSDKGAVYTYDALNRLTQVAQTGLTTQTYGYDINGRRISKTVGADTSHFLYNGLQIISVYTNNWTVVPVQYVHGSRMDEIVVRQTATAAQYYHQDGLNNLVAITNATGTTDATQKFNAWGSINVSTGASQYFGYTGREKDETGLMYYRARYYAPDLGRFTQQDPFGLRGGLNYYAYVNNNPINFIDPLGYEAWIYIEPRADQGFDYIAFDNLGSSVLTGTFNTQTWINTQTIQAGDYTVSPRPHIETNTLQDIRDFFMGDRNDNEGIPTISNSSDWNTIINSDGSEMYGVQIHPGRTESGGGVSEGCLVCSNIEFGLLNKLLMKNYSKGGVHLKVSSGGFLIYSDE